MGPKWSELVITKAIAYLDTATYLEEKYNSNLEEIVTVH